MPVRKAGEDKFCFRDSFRVREEEPGLTGVRERVGVAGH